MNNRIILVLLIAAIVLSVLSVVLTLSFDTSKVSSTTIIREKGAEPATVGLVIQGTVANTNG